MEQENVNKVVFLVIVAIKTLKDRVLSMLLDTEIHLISTSYCRGVVKTNYLANTFALTHEENNVMISCVTTSEKADEALKSLSETFHFNDKAHKGIAFTIPLDTVSY